MHIYMRNAENLAPEQMAKFLEASQEIDFAGNSRAEVYQWVQQMLTQQEYFASTKRERGSIRAYLAKVTGRSLPQITRLIRQYRLTYARMFRRFRLAQPETIGHPLRILP